MLLQRLRGIDYVIESTIVINLIPLALAASNDDVVEVYRAFSQLSRSAQPENPRTSSNAVLAAQTSLARGMVTRLDCADGYLTELLTLFAEKGTQIQIMSLASTATSGRDKSPTRQTCNSAQIADMKASLAALLIPISTLLSHTSFSPHVNSGPELVAHFRNMWFLCVAFGFSGQDGKKRLSEHEFDALQSIAEKTPAIILESATDYVASDLEFNSILRKDFASSVSWEPQR